MSSPDLEPTPPESIPPEETLRLFDGYSAEKLAHPSSRDFVIERLLEEGDRRDLRWLIEAFGEAEIERVFHNARGLSRRSRRFWSLVLHGRLDIEPSEHEDLWPL